MSNKVIRIDGLDNLIKDLNKYANQANEKIKPTIYEAGDIVLNAAKERVRSNESQTSYPKTNKLVNSLHLERKPLQAAGKNAECYITWNDDVRAYAAPLELGHVIRRVKKGPVVGTSKPRPFLRPAFDENKKYISKIIITQIKKTFDELVKKK